MIQKISFFNIQKIITKRPNEVRLFDDKFIIDRKQSNNLLLDNFLSIGLDCLIVSTLVLQNKWSIRKMLHLSNMS